MKMETKTTYNKLEDVLVCRTCLATDRKLYNIYKNNIFEAYKFLLGREPSPFDSLPLYICNFCVTLILKFHTFKRNIEEAQKLLEYDKITQSNLTTKYQLSLSKSSTKNIDIAQNQISELKCDYYELNEFDTQHFDYTDIIHNEDAKIYTDSIQKDISTTNNAQENNDLYPKSTISGSKSALSHSKSVQSDSKSKNTNTKPIRRSKNFDSDHKMRDFEKDFNVKVIILSHEKQLQDVLDRKLSSNYLQSPFKCELCFKGVMDEDSLKKHMLYQHDPSRGSIVCQFCQYRYKDKRGLNQHLKSHRIKFVCKRCNYISSTTFNAKEHYKMHTGYLHKCKHCGKHYEKLSSHLTHLRIHHPLELIWCNICGEAFIGEFGLNAHKKRAHCHLNLPFQCGTCQLKFCTESALNKHTSVPCNFIICIHCGENFNKTMDLRKHLLKNHRSLKVYNCVKCNKTFSRQTLLSAHYKRAHVDIKDKKKSTKPWICEICGKILPNKCLLQYHQRNHTGVKPYQCTICEKSFTLNKLLQSHLRVHSSDRPYKCNLCVKSFKGLSALRSHQQIHSRRDMKN